MASLLLGEGEQLVRVTRPHVLAYVPAYAAALLWAAWGTAASLVMMQGDGASDVLGWALAMLLVLLHAAFAAVKGKKGRVWIRHGVVLGILAVAWTATATGPPAVADLADAAPVAVLGAVSLVGLIVRQMGRHAERTYITNQRVVMRRGLAPRTENVVAWKDVRELRGVQGLLGGVFGFGMIRLVVGTKKVKEGETERTVEDVREVRGVSRFEEARRDVHALLEEVRMPLKDRQKRLEERRLRESMERLATWNPSQGR